MPTTPIERLNVRVRGQVQGVGFRPFVYRLARELDLTGWVLNDGHGVQIEVQGARGRLERFVERVRRGPERLSRVERVDVAPLGARPERAFRIRSSARTVVDTDVAPDTAVCADCLGEIFDPGHRRHRYAFTNCTHCGPRYTIIAGLPYDRARTAMAPFTLCARCRAEYADPSDRRFHAEPNACPDCGPRLALLDPGGDDIAAADPIAATVARLLGGEIIAIKGLGGFHLACDASDGVAVGRLRARKGREAKPFAVMVAGPGALADLVGLDAVARALLGSPERPIVLARKRAGCDERVPGVAPGLDALGVMLPGAPLHYLLFHEAAGRPAGVDWLERPPGLVLVMTSANPGGEPLVTDNDEALTRLRGIADAFLVHDRAIVERCDDSVVRPGARGPVLIRRARGYAPRAVALPRAGPPVLAVGGWLKNTVCVTRGDRAYLSQHVGDLDSRSARLAMEHAAAHLIDILDVEPALVARNLHPDYASSDFAERFAGDRGLAVRAVQHHHAHVAAVAGEHGLLGPVLGLALDGIGLGADGTAWGGELLALDGGFERLGHLAPLALPGGDAAAREPWRMAAAVLHRLGRGEEIARRWPGEPGVVLGHMLDSGLNCPLTSSAGRLFDAVAGLLGVRGRSHYEAQAAMELEALAAGHGPVPALAGGYTIAADNVLDLAPVLEHLVPDGDPAYRAALFHATFAEGLAAWAVATARARGLGNVVLAGGCMLNRVLSERLRDALETAGLVVHEARALPPNDGALSYGQACVALADIERG